MKSISTYLFSTLLALTLALPVAAAETGDEFEIPPSRLAIAAEAEGPDAAISGDVNQAEYFLLFDTQGNLLESIPNTRDNDADSVAKLLNAREVTVLVAGSFSEAAEVSFNRRDIIAVIRNGDVGGAVNSLLQCEPNPSAEDAASAATPERTK